MNKPRSAGELGDEFPYSLPTMCYIEVSNDEIVAWGTESQTCPLGCPLTLAFRVPLCIGG